MASRLTIDAELNVLRNRVRALEEANVNLQVELGAAQSNSNRWQQIHNAAGRPTNSEVQILLEENEGLRREIANYKVRIEWLLTVDKQRGVSSSSSSSEQVNAQLAKENKDLRAALDEARSVVNALQINRMSQSVEAAFSPSPTSSNRGTITRAKSPSPIVVNNNNNHNNNNHNNNNNNNNNHNNNNTNTAEEVTLMDKLGQSIGEFVSQVSASPKHIGQAFAQTPLGRFTTDLLDNMPLPSNIEEEKFGVGVSLMHTEADLVIVKGIMENGPCFGTGLRVDDLVLEANGVSSSNFEALVKAIKGPAGTDVLITVQRNGQLLTIAVTRGKSKAHADEAKRARLSKQQEGLKKAAEEREQLAKAEEERLRQQQEKAKTVLKQQQMELEQQQQELINKQQDLIKKQQELAKKQQQQEEKEQALKRKEAEEAAAAVEEQRRQQQPVYTFPAKVVSERLTSTSSLNSSSYSAAAASSSPRQMLRYVDGRQDYASINSRNSYSSGVVRSLDYTSNNNNNNNNNSFSGYGSSRGSSYGGQQQTEAILDDYRRRTENERAANAMLNRLSSWEPPRSYPMSASLDRGAPYAASRNTGYFDRSLYSSMDFPRFRPVGQIM